MLRLSTARSRWLALVAALALGLVLVWSNVGAQQGSDGAMAADCEGNSLAIEAECQFGDGQQFTVAIHVTEALGVGYGSVQMKLRWDDDIVDYLPTGNPVEEAVWLECAIPARSDNTAGLPDRPLEPSVLFACIPFPALDAPVSDEGPMVLFNFVCTGEGTSSLTLVPREGDRQQGSHFNTIEGFTVEPELSDASVVCGGPTQDRPPIEIDIKPPGTVFPVVGVPSVVPPENGQDQTPVESDGTPEQTPDGTTEAPNTTPTRIASDADGDEDGGLPVWAWVLIGLGIAVGVGGVGFAAWRRMNEEDGGTSAADATDTTEGDGDA